MTNNAVSVGSIFANNYVAGVYWIARQAGRDTVTFGHANGQPGAWVLSHGTIAEYLASGRIEPATDDDVWECESRCADYREDFHSDGFA